MQKAEAKHWPLTLQGNTRFTFPRGACPPLRIELSRSQERKETTGQTVTTVTGRNKYTISDPLPAEVHPNNGHRAGIRAQIAHGLSRLFAQRPCKTAQQGALLGCLALVSACNTQAYQPQPGDVTRMSFASETIHLVAPDGFCIDPKMTGHRAEGGFALLVPCASLRPNLNFTSRNRAMITVAVGPAGPADSTLSGAEILENAPGAKLVAGRNDLMLPLVKLDMPDHRARGASPIHWRGAFVLNEQLVAVALYAPEGSANLGNRGARLLDELTAKTLEASVTADLDTDESQ